MYEVSSFSLNGEIRKWTQLGVVRSKTEAVALADAQPTRTIVNKRCTSGVIHDNGKIHGGNPRSFSPYCHCPRCSD